jgi:hypothetical protein
MFLKSSLHWLMKVRTKGKQSIKNKGAAAMITQFKETLHRSRDTLLQDAVGAGALVVMLLVGLHLPGFI